MSIDIRRAATRFHTTLDWLDSWHSFSFADHHDPANTHHGLLLVSNDDVVDGGRGFGMHHHRDMEIVTWVLSGQVEHRDSQGNHAVIYPGLAQRMSAGSGIMHSEMNPSAVEPVRLVQMWVLPDTRGGTPGYQDADITDELGRGGLVKVASGLPDAAPISIRQKGAELRRAVWRRGRPSRCRVPVMCICSWRPARSISPVRPWLTAMPRGSPMKAHTNST